MDNILEKLGKGIAICGFVMLLFVAIILIQNQFSSQEKVKISPFYSIIALIFILGGRALKNIKI